MYNKVLKIIIATPCIMLLSMALVEILILNMSMGLEKSLVNTAASGACDFVQSESYKTDFFRLDNIKDIDGSVAVNGQIYEQSTNTAVYDYLFGAESDFQTNFIHNTDIIGPDGKVYWQQLESISKAYDKSSTENVKRLKNSVDVEYNDDDTNSLDLQDEPFRYRESLFTPMNISIPYFNKTVLSRMLKWTMTSYLSKSNSDNIIEYNGKKVVKYSGFYIYIDSIAVDSVDYKVYDKTDAYGLSMLSYYTGVDFSKVDSNRYVCLAIVNYSYDITWKGITPLGKAWQWFMSSFGNTGGGGFIDNSSRVTGSTLYYNVD